MTTAQSLAQFLNCRVTITEIEPTEFFRITPAMAADLKREHDNMQSIAELAAQIRKERNR